MGQLRGWTDVLFSCIFLCLSANTAINRPQSHHSADRKLSLIHSSLLFSCWAGRTKSGRTIKWSSGAEEGVPKSQSGHVDRQITITAICQQQNCSPHVWQMTVKSEESVRKLVWRGWPEMSGEGGGGGDGGVEEGKSRGKHC